MLRRKQIRIAEEIFEAVYLVKEVKISLSF